jgi:hypothetical protein
MSTQRRENRWQCNCAGYARGWSQIWLLFLVWFARAIATVGTAPTNANFRLRLSNFHPSDEDLSPGTPDQLATNSLQSGHRFTQPVRQELRRPSHSAPPSQAARRSSAASPATRRSALSLIPSPSVPERLHPSLAHIPAGQCRWTERYDGKRDLYFLNAA